MRDGNRAGRQRGADPLSTGTGTQARLPAVLVSVWVALAIGVFAALAAAVHRGATLTVVDQTLDAWLHAHTVPVITRVMVMLAATHSTVGMLLLTATVALYLARHATVDWVWTLLFAVPGAMLLNDGLKHIFRRPRPHLDHPLATLATFSFPSGHAAASTAFYGFLALWFVAHTPSRGRQWAALALAALMIALVAVSRLYLGVHFLSDVLAGICESVAWLGLCLLGRQWLLVRMGR